MNSWKNWTHGHALKRAGACADAFLIRRLADFAVRGGACASSDTSLGRRWNGVARVLRPGRLRTRAFACSHVCSEAFRRSFRAGALEIMAHAFSAAYLFGFQASALCGPAVSMIAREACADMAGFQRRVRSFLHGSYAAPLRFQRDSSAKPMRFRHAFPVDPSQTRRRFDLAGCRRTGFAIGALLGRGFCRRGAVSAVEMLRADPFVFAGGLLALRHVVAPDEARGASACKRGACLRMRPRVVLSGRGPRRMLDDRA